MIKRLLFFLLIEELLLFLYRWLRWIDWHRKEYHDLKMWQQIHAWFIYQVVSDYPPGELHHWFNDAPPFLFDQWRERINSE